MKNNVTFGIELHVLSEKFDDIEFVQEENLFAFKNCFLIWRKYFSYLELIQIGGKNLLNKLFETFQGRETST